MPNIDTWQLCGVLLFYAFGAQLSATLGLKGLRTMTILGSVIGSFYLAAALCFLWFFFAVIYHSGTNLQVGYVLLIVGGGLGWLFDWWFERASQRGRSNPHAG